MRTGDPYKGLKEWLRRYTDFQAGANRLYDRADELRGRIESARTSSLDGMPHTQGYNSDRIGAAIAELEEIEDEARAAQEAATAARREISAAIRQINGSRWADRREVLRLRYLDYAKWEDIAEKLFGGDLEYWDRAEAFLRRAYKLHVSALEELAQFTPLEHRQENDSETEDRK